VTRRTQAFAALPAMALAAVLVAGCGSHGSSAGPAGTGSSTPSAPSASDLVHMRKLVDDADSAAARADSDAAGDK
jgi:hypothetical protein